MRYHLIPVRMAIINESTKVLARMWRKGNPCALLVRMQIGAATMENIMEDSQKIKNRTAHDPVILLLGIYLKKPKTLI